MTECKNSSSVVRIGTSGYSYKDWAGVLYPVGTRSSDYLKLYSSEFDVAELNFSYYRMPDAQLSARMVSVTPPDFLFSVKAHKTLTHQFSSVGIASDVAEFVKGIDPIAEASKLAVILLQFPFSFHYNRDNREYLNKLCAQFGQLPLAVEFRNRYWQRNSVYEGLKERNIAYVNVDEPGLSGLPLAQDIVTSGTGYVRFHGRNSGNWWTGDNVSRYDYFYNDSELGEWVPRIEAMAAQAPLVLVVFNNHSRGQAVENARRLRQMLREENE